MVMAAKPPHLPLEAAEPCSRGISEAGLGLTAAAMTFLSDASTLPPGSAVCPGWERKDLDLVVSKTRKWPSWFNSKSRTRTEARLLAGKTSLRRSSA